MFQFWEELRYGWRILSKSPAVTGFAITSLALGIGANTAIFSLINALMLRTLPVPKPEQLVALSTITPSSPNGKEGLSIAMFEEIDREPRIFSGMFVWMGGGLANIEANGATFLGSVDTVSGEYFSTLGVRPIFGRAITSSDVALAAGSSARVAVLSYRCWRKRFNGDPGVLGKTVRVDGIPLTIIGVAPPRFDGLIIDGATEFIVPIGYSGKTAFRDRSNIWFDAVARLKPGVGIEQARAAMNVMWPRVLEAAAPEGYRGRDRKSFLARQIEVDSMATGVSAMRGRLSRWLEILMALVVFILLIACVNLANLMLARAIAKQREFGVRLALGAGRWRLIRQMMVESLLLSLAGGAIGVIIAFWTSKSLFAMLWHPYLPTVVNVQPDARVLGFAAAVALATGIAFGLAPARRLLRTDPATILQQNARTVLGQTGGLTRALTVTQVALSLVLAIAATLFARTLANLRSVDTGYNPKGVLVVQLFPQPGRAKIANRAVYYHELADRLRQLRGVVSVSYSHMGPAAPFEYKEPAAPSSSPDRSEQAVEEWVGPEFFRLIGMHLLSGREFEWRDDEHAPKVAIISESLARTIFPNQDPVGKLIDLGSDPGHKRMHVVGVVNSASLWKIRSWHPAAVYMPLLQEPGYDESSIDIRTQGDPAVLKPAVRRVMESMGHHYPLRMERLEQRMDRWLSNERVIAMLSISLGGLAFLLAGIGIYGLTAYAVSRRTGEIGIRMALGAHRHNVIFLMVRETVWLVLAGIAIALPVIRVSSRVIAGLLFGVSPMGMATIALGTGALLTVVGVAAFLPAQRAARIDPMTTLRTE